MKQKLMGFLADVHYDTAALEAEFKLDSSEPCLPRGGGCVESHEAGLRGDQKTSGVELLG